MKIEKHQETLILMNPQTNERVEILAKQGAMLVGLYVQHEGSPENFIKIPYADTYAIKANPFYPSALMTPWVNRVRNGNYSFLGRNYQLPINEPALGNAIHGLLARAPFEIKDKYTDAQCAKVVLSHHYQATESGYPFPFLCELTYTFYETSELTIQIKVSNLGSTPMPFACGWHPYFTIPGAEIKDLTIEFNAQSRFISDSQMIPLREETFEKSGPIGFDEEKIDHVFRLRTMDLHETTLSTKDQKTKVKLTQSGIDFPFLVVFAPENKSCVAIEPMTANTDAFNTGDGLRNVLPNESFKSAINISIKTDKSN